MAENLGPDVPQSQYNALGVQYTENFGRDEQLYMAWPASSNDRRFQERPF